MSVLKRLPIYNKVPANLKGLLRISPSQIEAGRLCLRRWKRSYVDWFKEPQAPSAALGDRVHIVLQDYLTDSKPFDLNTHEGRIANSGKDYLPQPKTGKCEGGFFIHVNNRWGWTGKIDWEENQSLSYIDHKTTSDFKWVKSADVLHKDPQGLLYGFKVIGDKSEQQGRWIYYRTKGAYIAQPVDITLSREKVADGMSELEAEAEKLISLRDTAFLDLPPSPDACNAFGRPCPHKDMCTDLDGPSLLKGIFMATKTKDELLASLRASAVGTPVNMAPGVPPVAVTSPANPTPPQPQVTAPSTPANLLALLSGGAAAVTPVQVAPSTPPIPQVATPTPGPQGVSGPAPSGTPEGANGPAFDPATQPGTPEAKRGRGRPPGSKNKTTLTVDNLAESRPVNPGPNLTSEIGTFGTLYVNCMPMHDEEYTIFPEVCGAGIVVDTRTFVGRDNLPQLMQKATAIVMPIP